MGVNKKKISKEEFAEILYKWLLLRLTKRKIKKFAKEIDFKIKNNADYDKLYNELFILNQWLIFYSCKRTFENTGKDINNILDTFKKFVINKYFLDKGGTPVKLETWLREINTKSYKYTEAMFKKDAMSMSLCLWVTFSENLFGQIEPDIKLQLELFIYITSFIETFTETTEKNYEIES